jgi:hypothetical protein
MSRRLQRKATVAASSLSLLRPSKTTDDSAASSIANRLVTPSPRLSLLSSSSKPKLIGKYELSSNKQTPRKKPLFVKKGSSASRKHTIITTTTTNKAENFLRSSSILKDTSSYSPKKLFSSPPDANDNLASSGNKNATTLTIRKGRVRNKKPSTATTLNVSTRRRRTGENRSRRNFMVGDSLATAALITKTAPVIKKNAPKVKNEKKTSGKKRSERHPVVIATMGPNVNQENDESPTRQTPISADTNAEQLINDSKKKICSSRIIDDIDDINNNTNNNNKKRNNSKNKNTVPAEYIPLLASRAQAVQSTRARSISEILNDISKKKELELKNNRITGATRARLPRVCKRNKKGSFQESATDDENDEELEEKPEEEDDDDDDDNDRTGGQDSLLIGDQHEDKRNDNVATTLFSTGIASARTNANSPKLKPRTRSFLSSSTMQDRGFLSVVSKDPVTSLFAEEDNFEKGVVELPPKMRRRSRRYQGSSFQHQEESKNNFDTTTTNEGSTKNLAETTSNTIAVPFRQSEATHMEKNMGTVSSTPASRKTNKNRENTSGEKEQQKGALQRKRQSSIKRKRIGPCKNDTTEDDMINNSSSLSSKRNQQRQLVQPSRLSSRRRAQHHQQFSMEEYSVYSNYSSHEEPEQQEKVRTVMNPSQVSVAMKESHLDDATGVSNKVSNNLTMPRRENQQCKLQNNSSLSEGEQSKFSVSVCTKNYESSPSQRRTKQQQRSPRQKDKEGKASKKRVRFDSSTTTFSVKIKIKTNLDTSRNSKDRRNRNDHNTLPPSLDESTVQAIANQVTQACLTQAASTRIGTCNTIGTCRDPGIDIDVDVNDEEQMSSPSSEVSSKSTESSDAKEVLEEEKGMSVYLNEIVDKQSVPINNTRINRFPLREGHDDGRSITSELTSDWNRPSRFLEKNVVQFNKDRNTCSSSVPQEHNKGRQEQDHGNACLNETFHFANDEESENDYQDTDPATVKLQRSAQDASTTQSNGEKRSRLPVGRRQRMWHCSDSLAGSCADWSKVSTVADLVAKKVPREVTMLKPLSRSEGRCRSRIGLTKTMQSSTTATKSSEEMNAENNDKTREGMGKKITVIPVTPNITRKSRLVPLSPTYCCGKCKGCRRTLDCQTCDFCLEKLHCYGSLPSPSTNERLPLCLLRSCQRTCRVGRVDSLLDVASLTKPIQPKSNKNERGEHKKEHSHQESVLSKQLAENHIAAGKEKQDFTSKNIKAPWDDGDDWTVDYSYLSDPRHRGKISTRGSKKSSHSTSLYASSWSLPLDKNRVKAGLGSGGRTSLSSVSESVISQKRSTQLPAAVTVFSNKRGRGRSVKRKRDPLHGLSLPSTSTDARNCLRALMEYDEADQDWV